jgi:hypothetical protein
MRARANLPPLAQPIPWHVWCAVLAVTSAMVGVHWDISWHRSIGRDTFFTAPHIAIHLCGVLAGIASGFLILDTTFRNGATQPSVRIWGFRGPLGAFICAWGGIAMLASAPFDDWWHNAYGLDVKIISPPHALLALGMFTVQLGALILVLGYLNRAEGAQRRTLERLFVYIGGMMLVMITVFLMEKTDRSDMHTGAFYLTLALALPLVLVGVSRASGHRWGATHTALVYTVFQLAVVWILPRFPAVPKLGPVYYPTTQFVPPPFPLLLLVPAVALDLLRARAQGRLNAWLEALLAGGLFLLALLIVQWPFANFLLSPLARNWVFATHYFGYNTRRHWADALNAFSDHETRAQFWRSLSLALVAACLLARAGIAWGDWMKRIRR